MAFSLLSLEARADGAWALSPGLFAGVRPHGGGLGGQGTLSLTWRFAPRWQGELTGAAGAFAQPSDAVLGLDVGVRWLPFENPSAAGEPFLSAALVHQHEVPFAAYAAAPGEATAGVCDCIHHRTGIALSAGLLLHPTARWPLDVTVRLRAAALLPRAGGEAKVDNVYLGPSAAVGWRF